MLSTAGRHLQRGYWRASKRWCKQMSEDAVQKALVRFANNGAHASAMVLQKQAAGVLTSASQPANVQLVPQAARAFRYLAYGAPGDPK